MKNPILQAAGRSNLKQIDISPIRNMISAVKNAGNPQAMLMRMAQNNPQFREAVSMVNQYGGDPKTAFYKIAEQKGIDPEAILSQLNQI